MILKSKYSPNYSKRLRKNSEINLLVIHYTGMQSKIESIKRLSDPLHKVSCHYLIDRKGEILKMVDDKRVAWHAGKSKWKNFIDLNKNSIGIELVNKGHFFGYQKFAKTQINQIIKLCLKLKKKYKINNSNIVGHSDIAPFRKLDPGEKFPWKKLKENNLGIWSDDLKYKTIKIHNEEIKKKFFKNLFKIGYRYFARNKRNQKDALVIKAFQRRFLQNNITGQIDEKTYKISHFLALNGKN